MGFVSKAIEPERIVHAIVGQDRLLSFIDDISAPRVTTVSAPAGSGKSVAMQQWAAALARRGRKCLWLAPRAGIKSVDEFVSALSAAAIQAGYIWPEVPITSAPTTFVVALMAAQPQPPVLFVDDVQTLSRSVLDFLCEFITTAQDSLTTVLAFRGLPMFHLARLQSLGLVLEVTAADLRFSYEDTVDFFKKNIDITVDEPVLRQLVDDTQGWAAGMAIALGRLRSRRALDEAPAPRLSRILLDFEQYFAEEVIAPQSQEVRDFILATAVLDEMTVPACNAVMQNDDSRHMLEFIEAAGLFMESADLERGTFAYHPLFRAMILRRLRNRSGALAYAVHRRASLYFAGAGQPSQAIEHAAACGDQEFLADQLDLLAEPLIYGGHLYRIDELSSKMTFAIIATRPMLLLALAWRSIRRLAFSSAEKLIRCAEDRVNRQRAEGGIDEFHYIYLQRMIAHRRVMLDAALDDMPKVERSAEKLLTELGDDHAYLSCTLLAQLMAARRELYHFQDMQKLEAETRRALSRPGSDFASIALNASVAPTLVVQGKTESARRLLQEALILAYALQGEGSGLAALPALPLAELLYDCGELEEARKLVDAHMSVARDWGFVDQLSAGHLVRARLFVCAGDVEAALAGLEEANLTAIECGLDRLRALVMAEQVRILIRAGMHAQAQRVFDICGLAPETEPLPTLNPLRRSETVAIAWLRLEIANNRLPRARKIANRWCELARRTGVLRSIVTFELLLAEIAVLSGNRSEARRAVREAVSLAAVAGWTRIFLDEGEVIGSLLIDAYGQGPILDTAPDRLAARLVTAFKGAAMPPELEEDYGLGSKLANRELDILSMVAGGLRNREIGNRLGLTEGTVKWYMQQIYDKLGVRRRPQAVMRARQLGVLA